MAKIMLSGFFVVVAVVIAYAVIGCQLEMEADSFVADTVDVSEDTTGDSDMVEVDVSEDTTTAECGQFFNYWQCFCQSGLCSGQLWKTVVPCAQGDCATVTDVTEVDGTTYKVDNCADIGEIEDGVLVVSTGDGLEKTTYLCVPAPAL